MTATFSQDRQPPTTNRGVLDWLRDYWRVKDDTSDARKRRRQLSERRAKKK